MNRFSTRAATTQTRTSKVRARWPDSPGGNPPGLSAAVARRSQVRQYATLITAIASQITTSPASPVGFVPCRYRDPAQRDAERHGDDREGECGALAPGGRPRLCIRLRLRVLAGLGVLTWLAGQPARQPRVDPGVDLPADLVEEGVDDGRLIVRAEFVVGLGGGSDLVRG